MVLAEDHEVVECFGFDALHKPFCDRVQIRLPRANTDNLDTLVLENISEEGTELGVEIMDQEARFVGIRIKLQTHVLGLLSYPGRIGIGAHPSDMNAASSVVDKEEHMDVDQPFAGPDFLGEEIAGPEGINVTVDELIPGGMSTFRTWIQACFIEDVTHGRTADPAVDEPLDLTENARVAPTILTNARCGEFAYPNPIEIPGGYKPPNPKRKGESVV
jgi:hypothetical protein